MAYHDTSHDIVVEAAADPVYRLIADAAGWPQLFRSTVHVDLLLQQDEAQLLRVWAIAGGRIHDWTSRRTLDPLGRRIGFEQIVSKPPVASMRGQWSVDPAGPAACRVTLAHRFAVIGDDPASVDWVEELLAQDGTAELLAIKAAAERGVGQGRSHLSFSDAETIRGSASAAFDFLRRADLWPDRLPHVRRVELAEEPGGIQRLTVQTQAADGTVHTYRSIRVCLPHRREIVYKQVQEPGAVAAAHSGRWQIEEGDDGVFARSWHTVALDLDGIRRTLGPEVTIAEARVRVREVLSADSLLTLAGARQFVERGLR